MVGVGGVDVGTWEVGCVGLVEGNGGIMVGVLGAEEIWYAKSCVAIGR